MNQLKLSLRAADDPRTIKEENGVPVFASVFSLHNATRKGREETLPITVKASHELAQTLVNDLRKGVAFIVEGQLAYYKSPETNREIYSVWAEKFTDISPPKSTPAKAGQSL
jgi:single-stranded DNA-binding protein